MQSVTMRVKAKYEANYRQGYPLMTKESMMNVDKLCEEGMLVKLVNEKNKFIAQGYYGKQNKGIGWILSYDEQERIDSSFFKKRLKSALEKRQDFFSNSDTTAFRVFNAEGDGIGGLTIDYFDGYYVFNWYSEGIYSFQEQILQTFMELVEYRAIYQKKRFSVGGQYIEEDDFVAGERGNFPIIVKENGVSIAVHLNEGAMVGVFLDQRDVRKTILERYAKGRTVLNTFSYTGVFSVFAAKGGASKTTSVDLANRSREKTIEQFNINGIDPTQQEIIVEDVFKYFKYAERKNKLFDLVILDPPSFARSKKFTFRAEKDYTNLLKEAIAITAQNGVIVASTNCATFDMKRFKSFVETAFKESKKHYTIIEEFTLPRDFQYSPSYKEGNYLKVLFIKLK